jgi:hypothetical protein
MPAIAPPESPFFEPLETADEDGEGVDVEVGSPAVKVINEVMVGSLTLAHLDCAWEL